MFELKAREVLQPSGEMLEAWGAKSMGLWLGSPINRRGQLKDGPVALWRPGGLGFSTLDGSAPFKGDVTWARGLLSPSAPNLVAPYFNIFGGDYSRKDALI